MSTRPDNPTFHRFECVRGLDNRPSGFVPVWCLRGWACPDSPAYTNLGIVEGSDDGWAIHPHPDHMAAFQQVAVRWCPNPLDERYPSEDDAIRAAEALARAVYPEPVDDPTLLAIRGGEDPYAAQPAPFPGYDPEFGKNRKARFEELFRTWNAAYAMHSRQCGMTTWTLLHADSIKKSGGEVVVLVRKQASVDNMVHQAKSMGLCLDRSNFRTIYDANVRLDRWFYIVGTDRTTVVLVDNDALSSYIWDLTTSLADAQDKIEDIRDILDRK